MKTLSCVCKEDYRNLHDMHKFQGCEDLGRTVLQLQWGPPLNVRCQRVLQKSYHDVFNGREMEVFCDFAEYVLRVDETHQSFLPLYSLSIGGRFFAFARKR